MPLPTDTQIFGVIPGKASRVDAASKSKFIKGITYPLGKLLSKKPLGNIGKVKNVNYFTQSSDLQLIKGMLRQLLLTKKGERIMNPSFGLKLDHFVFEPLDITTFEIIKSDIINQIKVFLPFLDVAKIKIYSSEGIGGNILYVRLQIRVRNISSIAPFEIEVQL